MKIDPKKQIPTYRAPHTRFEIVAMPATQYLMIDGHGDPNTATAYRDALQTMYPVAYKLKFFSKNELQQDYVVSPLEALWWSADLASFTSARDKSQWDWTVLLFAPDWLTTDHVDAAVDTVRRRGGAPRSCTSAPTTTKEPCCTSSTVGSSPTTVSNRRGSTTRSTSPTPAAPPRKNSVPSSVNLS